MSNFKILITSVPDREKLVAEIWFGKNMIAEINQETEDLKIEFYLAEKIIFDMNEFSEVLEKAKSKLQGKKS